MEFASARISPPRYYAFYSQDQQKYYYKDSKTGDILWEYPYKGIVLDGNTYMKFDPKQDHSKVPIPSSFKSGVIHPFNSLFTLPPMESILQGKKKSGTLEIKNNRGSSSYDFGFLKEEEVQSEDDAPSGPNWYPPSLLEDQKEFDYITFAKNYCHKHTRDIKKRDISPEDMLMYDDTMKAIPLSRKLPRSLRKKCTYAFNFILEYGKSDKHVDPEYLIQFLSKNKDLVGEILLELIKQTRNNPNFDNLKRTWNLFLVVATIFHAPKHVIPIVRQTCAATIFGPQQELVDIATLCYLRFIARNTSDENLTEFPNQKWIMSVWKFSNHDIVFGVSLYEQLWQQKDKYPLCPIPYYIHHLCYMVMQKGATRTEKFLSLTSNIDVKPYIDSANNGNEDFSSLELDDLVTIMKTYFKMMPGKVIPISYLSTAQGRDRIQLAESLPAGIKETLAYLIGFLKKFITIKCQYDSKALAMAFAKHIICFDNKPNAKVLEKEIAIGFISTLLRDWNVSFIYPLSRRLLQNPNK